MTDLYIYIIIALLPISAISVVLQKNPFNALILRGVLGAVATLAYAVLGAADVALTEALMGTMLAVTLYAVALRSSMIVKVGVLTEQEAALTDLRQIFQPYFLLVEVIKYSDVDSLFRAIADKEIHAVLKDNLCETSIPRLYEIMSQNSPTRLKVLLIEESVA